MVDNPLPSGATAHEYISRKWGAPMQALPLVSVVVGTAVVQAANNNPRRMELHIINVGVADVFAGFDAGVTTSKGIKIPANGGALTLLVDEDADLVTYNVYLIAGQAGVQCYVLELQTV